MSAAKHTPAERADLALSNPRAMCDLLAAVRSFKAPGWWDGSAFRRHHCGLIVGTIKLTNHWHVDQLCDVAVTDGAGWDTKVCQDSFAHGDPHPRPIEGGSLTVWRCGRWADPLYEQQLRDRLLSILTTAAEWVEARESEQTDREEAQQLARAAAHDRMAAAAIAKATGSAA